MVKSRKILVKKELQALFSKGVVFSGFAPKYPWAFRGLSGQEWIDLSLRYHKRYLMKGAATFFTTSAHPYQQRYNGNNLPEKGQSNFPPNLIEYSKSILLLSTRVGNTLSKLYLLPR